MENCVRKHPRVSLVVCIKDESDYIFEHYLWYKSLGIDNFFYIYNDCSDETVVRLRFLSKYDKSFHLIENIVPAGKPPQISGYQTFFDKFKKSLEDSYLFIVDIDEFFFSEKFNNIHYFLSSYNYPDVLSVNWRIFGSSGLERNDKEPVLKRFQKASNNNFLFNKQLKSLVKVSSQIAYLSAHIPYLKKPYRYNCRWIFACQGDEQAVPNSIRNGSRALDVDYNPYLSIAQINHYAIKSLEEFNTKSVRGRGMEADKSKVRHNNQLFKTLDKNDIPDGRAYEFFSSIGLDLELKRLELTFQNMNNCENE